MTRSRRLRTALAAAAALLAAACGSDGGRAPEPTVPATFDVRPGVEQVAVTGAEPGTPLTLYRGGAPVITLVTDDLGQATFLLALDEPIVFETGPDPVIPAGQLRTLPAGTYEIRDESRRPAATSGPFRILDRDDVPPPDFYDAQELVEGFQYLETRDGTKLSVAVWFPDARLWGPPPWPTVVNYSGYSPSNPDDRAPGMLIANYLGYAAIGVNVRGTGCSGGIFEPFSPAQQADGYDVIEVAARQPWVLHGQVGMVGLSFPGIMQLYTASTRPPGLAAIAPQSVIEDPWRQQWPGGVYNRGFTKNWLAGLDGSSAPLGTGWVRKRVEGGDTTCEAHQDHRNQSVPIEPFAETLEFYPPDADDRRLSLLVRSIEVPVFLTGGWQDEQTGPRFATMLDDFVSTDRARFTMYNGHHPDGYSPLTISKWWEFLELYVRRVIPRQRPLFRLLGPLAFEQYFGVQLGFENDRFTGYPTYEEALAAYEAERPVTVLFESGAGTTTPGAHAARFGATFDAWPPPQATAREWWLGPAGTLADAPPGDAGLDSYRHDPEAGPVIYTDGGDWQGPLIETHWEPPEPGTVLSYLTEPLAETVVVVGNGGWADLWIESDAGDVTVELTITEVRPDGNERLVQSGTLRLGHHHAVDSRASGPFLVDYTYREQDFVPWTPDRLERVRVPIRPFAHAFREGARLRLVVSTPGRDAPLWAYENPDHGGREVHHRVAWGGPTPSSLRLPVVAGIDVPPEFPPCPSLRGQPCRPYVPLTNR